MPRPLDAYYTDPALARALVGLLDIRPGDEVLEPHAGGGAFVDALLQRTPTVVGADINPTLSWYTQDFLTLEPTTRFDWVVGNPPFTDFEKHVAMALTIAPRVAFLLRLTTLASAARIPLWKQWPLRRLTVLAERPSFTSDGRSDSCDYGWFLFDWAWKGRTAEVVPAWSWRAAARALGTGEAS